MVREIFEASIFKKNDVNHLGGGQVSTNAQSRSSTQARGVWLCPNRSTLRDHTGPGFTCIGQVHM